MKVRSKIMVVVLFVAVVPTVLVAWTTLRVHETAYDAQRAELHLRAAEAGASFVAGRLEDRRRSLASIVQQTTYWPALSAEEREGAAWLVFNQFAEIAAVAVIDGQNVLQQSAFIPPGDAQAEWSDRARIAPEQWQDFLVGLEEHDLRPQSDAQDRSVEIGARRFVPLALSVQGEAGGQDWTVLTLLSATPLCEGVGDYRPDSARVALFDTAGSSICAASETASPVRFEALEGQSGTVRVPGDPVRLASVMTAAGWTVAVEQTEETALAAARSIRRQALLWLVLGLVGALFAGGFMARDLTEPLRVVEEAALRVAGGDFDQKLATGDDELGQVGVAFNRMSAEIQTWNQELHDRVEEKTKALRDAQDELLEARKLGAMASLTAGVSHEINNPLTSVLAFAQILLADARDSDRADQARQLEILESLETEAHRIRHIVKKMQDLANSRAGGRPVPVRFEEVVDRACGQFKGRFEANRIDVQREMGDSKADVLGDREQLETMVANLVENAVLAMQGKERRLTLRSQTLDDELFLFEVSDTGKGIEEENLDRVFDPFFTTKDSWRGVGLGLSLAHRIAAEHQGAIRVESEVGVGTTFRVTLPLKRERGAHLV